MQRVLIVAIILSGVAYGGSVDAENWYQQNLSALNANAQSKALAEGQCTDPRRPPADRIKSCESSLAHGESGNQTFMLGLADAQRLAGEYGHAIATYDLVLQSLDANDGPRPDVYPRYVHVLTERAVTNIEAGKPDLALAALQQISDTAGDNGYGLNSRCWIRAVAGVELDKAHEDCDKAVAMDSEDSDSLDSRALVEIKQKNFQACRADADAASDHRTHLPSSFYMRAYCAEQLGDMEHAKNDYERASKQDPNIADEFAKYGVPKSPGSNKAP